MKYIIASISLLLAIVGQMLYGFDALFEYKLKLQEEHLPAKDWRFLTFDDSFVLSSDVPEGFIKMGVCLKTHGDRFYILDNNLHKLAVFDKKGRFIRTVGISGRGPGDIHYPSWFEFYKERIYISNYNGIDVFNSDMTFSRRIRSFLLSLRFIVRNDHIYTVTQKSYRGKFPVFLRLNMDGSVEKEYFDPSFEKSRLRFDKDGDVVYLKNRLVFISEHRNLLSVFNENGMLENTAKIQYPFLDDLGKWNDKYDNSGKGNMYWFANIFASARVFQDELYVLLMTPRLEILSVNLEGHVKSHYYNNDDFRFMRWYDFDITEEEGKIVFYILGFSDGKEKNRDLAEFNVYRMIPSERHNLDLQNNSIKLDESYQ